MRISEIVGHSDAIRLLDMELSSQKLSHAYLLWGPRGSGRTLLATRLALSANCTSRPGEEFRLGYCGECTNCEKIIRGSHPDFSTISPDGGSIKISQIREMQSRISLRPNEAELKTWVIRRADLMTEEAQNCLLKVLEEPPGHALIILTAESPAALLPTVASRCHRVRMTCLPVNVLSAWAIEQLGLTKERARFLARLSGGLPGRVVRLASDAEYFETRDLIISTARKLAGCGDGADALAASEEILECVKKASGKAAEDDASTEAATIASPSGVCNVIAAWFRDLFLLRATGDEELVMNSDYLPAMLDDAQRHESGVFSEWAAHAVRTAEAIRANANVRLAMDDLFLSIALVL